MYFIIIIFYKYSYIFTWQKHTVFLYHSFRAFYHTSDVTNMWSWMISHVLILHVFVALAGLACVCYTFAGLAYICLNINFAGPTCVVKLLLSLHVCWSCICLSYICWSCICLSFICWSCICLSYICLTCICLSYVCCRSCMFAGLAYVC